MHALHFVFCRLISAQIANCRGQFLLSSVRKQTENKVVIDSLNIKGASLNLTYIVIFITKRNKRFVHTIQEKCLFV